MYYTNLRDCLGSWTGEAVSEFMEEHIIISEFLLFYYLSKNTLCVDAEKHLVRDMLCLGPPVRFREWVG